MEKRRELVQFYKKVMAVTFPIIIQNAISNFVNLLDNIMIGRVGTDQMSGVAIVNQLFFVFNLCIFGAISGAGIFSAQFYGNGDNEGVRDTFRFKMVVAVIITFIAIGIFVFIPDPLIKLYLHEGSATGDINATLAFGKEYMLIMLIGLLPFAADCCYSGTMRDTGETFVPMVASVAAILTNLVGNYVLIYGKFGAPELGVAGAAIATVVSRYVQLLIDVIWTHTHHEKYKFIEKAYRSLRIRPGLAKKIAILGFPLLINETLWSAGVAVQNQAYSIRGLAVVAGLNICSTISNMFSVVFFAMGDAVAIIVGQMLGSGKLKEAKKSAYRIIALSTIIGAICGVLMFLTAPLFPRIYNTTDEVRSLAGNFMKAYAILMPVMGFLHATYFTIRSGGKTFITFLFDSCFLWVIAVPITFVLSHYTSLNIVNVYFICLAVDLIKLIIGWILLVKGIWLQDLTKTVNGSSAEKPTEA